MANRAVPAITLSGMAFSLLAAFPIVVPAVEYPLIPEARIPVTEIRVTETAYAALRKPPGEGPFPAVLFLHGGLGRSEMRVLRRNAVQQPTQARFLSWGYVTVTATRRAIRHDPQDRGVVEDTLALVRAVGELAYVDDQSLALYGGSGGGTLALEVASVSDDLAAIVVGEPATIIYMHMFTREHIVFDSQGRPTGDRRWDVMNLDARAQYTAEIRKITRRKLAGLSAPTLVLHGDVHALKEFNLGVFVPEMKLLGKPVEVGLYHGEPHGFYWGTGRDPAQALRATKDADAFLRKHLNSPPAPVDANWSVPTRVEPRRPTNSNRGRQ